MRQMIRISKIRLSKSRQQRQKMMRRSDVKAKLKTEIQPKTLKRGKPKAPTLLDVFQQLVPLEHKDHRREQR
jgi:hypothetical protein